MSDYSSIEKFLHRLYLSNYSISKASFEIELSLFGKDLDEQSEDQIVFVTGLARSGTTSVMRKLYETGEYASLTYNNMPYLFMPNLWKNKKPVALRERAHKDGILVSGDSPEEFDEYFWKVFLDDSYIKEALCVHSIPSDLLKKYRQYVALICRAQVKRKYISKNNNNILRIESLCKLKNYKILFLYRNPLDHSASLLKLHLQFLEMQQRDPFITEYFNFLGHHEFGSNHKPFEFSTNSSNDMVKYPTSNINYWLTLWINYYQHLLEIYNDSFVLIAFEDLIHQPGRVYEYLQNSLSLEKAVSISESYKPPEYKKSIADKTLTKRALSIISQLNDRRQYNVVN
jgi:Leucine-rich repeat (LRR) protein